MATMRSTRRAAVASTLLVALLRPRWGAAFRPAPAASSRGGGPPRRPASSLLPRRTTPPGPGGRPLFAGDDDDDDGAKAADGGAEKSDGPDLLQPYLPALDPNYSVRGPIGEGDFLVRRGGPPAVEELSNEQMLMIVRSETTDLEVNTLVWKCLGYRFDEEREEWTPDEVFPKWKERFPSPPDLIGMRRVYSRDVDEPSFMSNRALVRSIPAESKQSLKKHLKPLGWTGFKYKELTPNKTRRAQCANWLIFYREELFGYTVEELKERRRLKQEAEEAAKKAAGEEEKEGEWKYPLKEVY